MPDTHPTDFLDCETHWRKSDHDRALRSPAMTDTLDELRERHSKRVRSKHCRQGEDWPCDTSVALAHIDTLTAAVERAREILMDPPSFDQRTLALNELDAILRDTPWRDASRTELADGSCPDCGSPVAGGHTGWCETWILRSQAAKLTAEAVAAVERPLRAHIDALTAERDAWRKSAEDAFAELRGGPVSDEWKHLEGSDIHP